MSTVVSLLIGTNGPIGIGKSIDMMLVDPSGYVFGPPGCGLGVKDKFFGDVMYAEVQARCAYITDFEQLVELVEQMADGRIPARNWVGDDVTTLMKTTMVRLREHFAKNKNYDYWDAVDKIVNRLKVASQKVPVIGMLNAHSYQPSTDEKGRFHAGGMDVGGPRGAQTLQSILHTLYRVEPDATAWPHPVVYRCDKYDTRWTFKDRMNVVDGVAPANLREILRVHGRVVPRYPGLEWLDDVADAIVAKLKADASPGAKSRVYGEIVASLRSQNVPDHFIWWGVRDGFDRATLATRTSFLDKPLAVSGTGSPATVFNTLPATK